MEVLVEGHKEEGTHRGTDRQKEGLRSEAGVGSRAGEMDGLGWTGGRRQDGWLLSFVYWQPPARHRRGRGTAAGTSEGS